MWVLRPSTEFRRRRFCAGLHLDGTLEKRTLVDCQRGGFQFTAYFGGLVDLHRGLRLDVPIYLAVDDNRATDDIGVDPSVLADHQHVVGGDRADEARVKPNGPFET